MPHLNFEHKLYIEPQAASEEVHRRLPERQLLREARECEDLWFRASGVLLGAYFSRDAVA